MKILTVESTFASALFVTMLLCTNAQKVVKTESIATINVANANGSVVTIRHAIPVVVVVGFVMKHIVSIMSQHFMVLLLALYALMKSVI